MKAISKYKTTRRIQRIINVAIPRDVDGDGTKLPPAIEVVSGEPNELGKVRVYYCTPQIFAQVLGQREGNIIRPLLRGDQRHTMLARFADITVAGVKYSAITGVDRLPLRYFIGSSGPVQQKENRKDGFDAEWIEDHQGFRIDAAYLGMGAKDLEILLEDIRKNLGDKKSLKTKCGHNVSLVDGSTLRIKNPKPFVEQTI